MVSRFVTTTTALACSVALLACADKNPPAPIVFDAAPTEVAPAPAQVDLNQCPGCQLAPQLSWSFAGVYRDASCTEPLAQATVPACGEVPNLGAVTVTYVDEIGSRKAGGTAEVTLTEAIGPEAARFRKTAKGCVAANEAATNVAPTCAGNKVCRTPAGTLACENCRTFADGCPDYEESRLYAAIDDPSIKVATGGGGGGGGLGNLRACCNALSAEAKRLGPSPEAGMLQQAATTCSALASSKSQGVEFTAIRSMMAGRKLPAICAGL